MTTRSRNVGYASERQLPRALPSRKEVILTFLVRVSFGFPPRWDELLEGESEPRGVTSIGYTHSQGIPGHLNRGLHPANHLNATKGASLILRSVVGNEGPPLGLETEITQITRSSHVRYVAPRRISSRYRGRAKRVGTTLLPLRSSLSSGEEINASSLSMPFVSCCTVYCTRARPWIKPSTNASFAECIANCDSRIHFVLLNLCVSLVRLLLYRHRRALVSIARDSLCA